MAAGFGGDRYFDSTSRGGSTGGTNYGSSGPACGPGGCCPSGYFANSGGGCSPGTQTGGGSATTQATALKTLSPISVSTQVNPMQQSAYDAAQGVLGKASAYEAGLASGTNEEITREIGRQRDEISVGLRREGESAMARGADPTLFRSRALQSGARGLIELQGRLADVALQRRQGAIQTMGEAAGGMTSAAAAAAGEQRALQLGTISAQLEAQRNQIAQDELENRINQQPYEQLLDMMSRVTSYQGLSGDVSGTLSGGLGMLPPPPRPGGIPVSSGSYTSGGSFGGGRRYGG